MTQQRAHQVVATIKTTEMYLAVFDACSVANLPNKWNESLDLARDQSALEPDKQMFYFNSIWSEYAASNHLLAWTFNFDGVYRIEIVVLPKKLDTAGVEFEPFIGVKNATAQLQCPSGELIVTSLHDLGNTPDVSVKVSPGLYEVALTVDWEQQDRHQFLEGLEDYPQQDGPDWTLYMAKID